MSKADDQKIEPVKITVDKRWQAARRLAAGDDLYLAAARAGLHEDQLAWMLERDPGFVKLSQAAQAVQELPPEERQAAAAELALESLEDQLGSRNATVLNQAIKMMGHFRENLTPEELPVVAKHALFMSSLSWKELAQYLWIGVRDSMPADERRDMPFDPPEDFEERIRVLNSKLQSISIPRDEAANDDGPPEPSPESDLPPGSENEPVFEPPSDQSTSDQPLDDDPG